MPKLYRPYIPLEVRCRVLLRQLGESSVDSVIASWRGNFGESLLPGLLGQLAVKLGCADADLRLDHDPPLALRVQVREGLGRTRYIPDANDPEHLIYRTKANHDIKTRVRGDGAQFSDLALIRREKKRRRQPKPKRPWPKRPFQRRAHD